MRSAGETQERKMPREYFDYTREKLVSFNRQIHDLLSADFPIPRTRVALENIRVVFEAQLQRIDSLGIVYDVIRKETCAHINVMIKKIPSFAWLHIAINQCPQFIRVDRSNHATFKTFISERAGIHIVV